MLFEKHASDIDISGIGNITSGGDLKININGAPKDINEIFELADKYFKSNIEETGTILRSGTETVFSSQELFTSLMQIGIPFEASIRIPFNVTTVLSSSCDLDSEQTLSTSDIRVAVVHCISSLRFSNHSEEEVYMWAAAYIRRYGNPSNQFLKVIDNENENELNYRYVREIIIPHLLRRIIGLNSFQYPEREFPEIFSSTIIGRMAKEIIRMLNTLNLYTIRYKTLIYLLQDLVLEPPHPWIVNEKTIEAVTEYNILRAEYHYKRIRAELPTENVVHFNHSYIECVKHLCASILSKYGAFLGIGTKYGLLELRRILKMKQRNPALWKCCNICELDDDLKYIGCSSESLSIRLDRIVYHLNMPELNQRDVNSQVVSVKELAEIVVELMPQSISAIKKFQQALESSRC